MGSNQDFLENLFNSVDIIVQSRLNDLGYDKTELCTIEEVRGDKEYYVSNGSARFTAYAQGTDRYTKGMSVYVTVPQGNYNNQKIIIGRYSETNTEKLDWVSPMENFVNITGNLAVNVDKAKCGLTANKTTKPYAQLLWEDTTNSYIGYDRVCISADFTNALMSSNNVIDGSYGLILVGDYEDSLTDNIYDYWNDSMSKNLDSYWNDYIDKENLNKLTDEKQTGFYNEIKTIKTNFKNAVVQQIDETKDFLSRLNLSSQILKTKLEFNDLNKKIEKELINKDNNLYDEIISEIDKKYATKEAIISGELFGLKSAVCILDSKDMIGNPYNFVSPFNQQKLFSLNANQPIKNLKLYFYRDLNLLNGKFEKTFIDMNNEFIPAASENNIFVENINVGFGYSFEKYNTETAILYTPDPVEYRQGEVEKNEEIKRTLRLRWVHFNDGQSYSIEDINNKILQGHYVKVHWYRYLLKKGETIQDPLAGYFWKEIDGAKDLFELTISLNKNWVEENFKVIIEFDGSYIESEILEFKNPTGTVKDGNSLLGLKINFPDTDTDVYQGNFFFFDEMTGASSISDIPFKLIADYEQIQSMTGDNWDTNDIICWKFPADNTMIKMPVSTKKEINGEYNEDNGDVFIAANATKSQIVGGVEFEPDPNYHQIIRKIVAADEDAENKEKLLAEETREQSYRIEGFYNPLAKNNTISCYVVKPKDNSSTNASIDFSFGYAKTNGTKYTLIIDWEETDFSDKVYKNPGAITWRKDRKANDKDDSTKYLDFNVKILNSGEDTGLVQPPKDGWQIDLSWYCGDCNGSKEIDDCFELKGNRLEVVFKPTVDEDGKSDNLYSYARYQILQVTVKNFDYALTKYIPLPIRTDRKIIGIEGTTSIIYDSTGHNPKYLQKPYVVRYSSDFEADKNKNKNYIWKIKYKTPSIGEKSEIKSKVINKGKDNEQTIKYYNLGNKNLPQIEQEITYDKAGNVLSQDNYYVVAPGMYLTEAGKNMPGIGTFVQSEGLMLWVQPLMVMCDPYGSQFLNAWDGSMLIDETNNLIMTSMIGAGTKSANNTFTGVIMGDLAQIEKSGENTFIDSGILGFQDGVTGFSLSTTGVATLGRPSTGQITLNGDQGYIISGGFNGFNGGAGIKDNEQPPRDENGNEIFNFGDLDFFERKGIYLGMDTGNACFAGTLYSTNGVIGGWKLDKYKIYREYEYTEKDENNNNITKIGRTIIQSPDVSKTQKNTVFAVGEYIKNEPDGQNYKNASFRVTEDGILRAAGAIIKGDITITSGGIDNGNVGDWTVDANGLNNGTTKSILLSAGGIGKSNLKVNNNAPTNNSNGWTIYANGNFGVDTKGNLFANNATIEGTIKATSGEIGGCKITEDGKLEVPAANITGTLTADKIDVSNIEIDAAQITSGTIASARIGDATITSAKIKSLAVSKINGGTNSNNITFSGNINCTGDITCSNLLATGGSIEGTTFKLKKSTSTTASKIQIIEGGAIYADGKGNFTATAQINCNNGLFATWIKSGGNITIGSTALSEANLKKLLALVS